MTDTEPGHEDGLTRRRFAAAVGAVGVAPVAGCSGDGDTDGQANEGGEETEGEERDQGTNATNSSGSDSDDAVPETTVELFGYRQTGREMGVIARSDGDPLSDAPVYLRASDESRGDPIGHTGADGRLAFLVPDQDAFWIQVVPDGAATGERSVQALDSCQSVSHLDEWFRTMQAVDPVGEVEYNPHEYTTPAMDGLFVPYARYDRSDGTFLPYLVADWTHEDDAMVASMREGITWENGEPVDAEALVFQWEILLEMDHPASRILTGVSATDTYEVRFEYEPGTNPNAVEHAVLHERADHPPADWQPVHDGDVAPADLEISEPTASGPLVLTDVTDEYRQYEVRNALDDVPDFVPACGQYNFRGYRVRYGENIQDLQQAMIARDADGVSVMTDSDQREYYPRQVVELSTPSPRGYGLLFNHDREPWNDRRVRKALAHSIDFERVVGDTNDLVMTPPDRQMGLLEPAATDRIDDDTRDELNAYEYDPDRAQSLLEEAGYELGEMEPTVPYLRGYVDTAVLTDGVFEQLWDVGWNPERQPVTPEELQSIERQGAFDVLSTYYVTEPHQFAPYFAFEHTLYGREGTPASVSGYASADEGATVEIDGDTVDVRDRIEELERTTDADRRDDIVADLARVVNEDLPYVQIGQRRSQTFLDEEQWGIPEESPHLHTERPHWWLPLVQERLDRVDSPGLLKANPNI